ncbi:hypothetical protein D3C72_1830490 [compost metagenome]
MNKIADTVVTRVKASIRSGITYISAAPSNRQVQEKYRPLAGTLRLERCSKLRGASPCWARPKSMRLVENTPLLAEEAAEVSTTKLMMLAAAGRPASTNSSTNGLLPGTTSRHGVTTMMVIRAST